METTLVPSYSLPKTGRTEDYATKTIVKKLDISHLTRPYPATLDFLIQSIVVSSSASFKRVREIEAITGRSFFKLINEQQLKSLVFVLAFVKDVQGNCAMFDAFALKPWLEKQGTNPKTLAKVIQVSLYTIGSLGEEFDFLEQTDSTFIDVFIRANGGDSQAQYELGIYYEEGVHITQDRNRAEHFFHLSAKAGNIKALLRTLPQMIQNEAFDGIRDLFGRINVEEAVQIGKCYVDLFYEEKIDLTNIRFEFLEAIDPVGQQYKAAYLKALCLQRGIAISIKGEKFVDLFEFAAQFCPKACYEIGCLALQNRELLAAEGYLIRAGKTHVKAQILLAEMYRGPSFQRFAKAFKILNRLHTGKVKEALIPLALMYLEGTGVVQNPILARNLLDEASGCDMGGYVSLLRHLKDLQTIPPTSSEKKEIPTDLQLQTHSGFFEGAEKNTNPYQKLKTSPRNLEGSGDLGSAKKVNVLADFTFPDDELPGLVDPPKDSDDESE